MQLPKIITSKLRSFLRMQATYVHKDEAWKFLFWRTIRIRLLRPDSVILIDVGAHEGLFLETARKHLAVKSAFLIDPQPGKIAGLRQRFQSETTVVYETAISDYSGTADFKILGWDESSSLKAVIPTAGKIGDMVDLSLRETIQVKVSTLDELLAGQLQSGSSIVLKLDVQGAEREALRGAPTVLAMTEMVICEVPTKPTYGDSASMHEIFEMLENSDFMLVDLFPNTRGKNQELIECDAIFIKRKIE